VSEKSHPTEPVFTLGLVKESKRKRMEDEAAFENADMLDTEQYSLFMEYLTTTTTLPLTLKLKHIDYLEIRVFQTRLRRATQRATDTVPFPNPDVLVSTCPVVYTVRTPTQPTCLRFQYSLEQTYRCGSCDLSSETCVFIAQGYLELLGLHHSLDRIKADTLVAVCENCFVYRTRDLRLCRSCMTQLTLGDKCVYCIYYFTLFNRYLDVNTYTYQAGVGGSGSAV
jgi:hypothetical protein